MCIWLMYGFIMTAAYGGQLRASLLSPDFIEPINTIRDIVDSGLTWEIVDYGDTTFATMKNQDGYDILMEKKKDIPFKNFPFETVSDKNLAQKQLMEKH